MAANVILDLDGVTGESQVKGYEGKIEIQSVSWGLSQASSLGSNTGGGVAQANFSDLSLSKYQDKSTGDLFYGCASGKHFDKLKLSFLRAGGDDPVVGLTYEMEDVMITSYQLSDSAGSGVLPMESLSFAYNTITVTATPQKDDGSGDSPTPVGWNVVANTKLG